REIAIVERAAGEHGSFENTKVRWIDAADADDGEQLLGRLGRATSCTARRCVAHVDLDSIFIVPGPRQSVHESDALDARLGGDALAERLERRAEARLLRVERRALCCRI